MATDTKQATPLDGLRTFLDGFAEMKRQIMQRPVGFAYDSLEDFVLKEGRGYEPRRLPKGLELGPPKRCFENTAKLVLFDPDGRYAYVEGYAGTGLFPVLHAWAVDREDGGVVDLTLPWGLEDHPRKLACDDGALFGVEIPTLYVREAILETGCWLSVLDDYERRWPLMRRPFREIRDA